VIAPLPPAAEDLLDRVLCPSCLTENVDGEPFCKKCGAPIGFGATYGPYESVLAQGHALRQAAEGRPKLVILLGTWLLFGPVVAIGLAAISFIMFSPEPGNTPDAIFVGLFGSLTALNIAILYRVTKNHFSKRSPAIEKEESEGS